MADTLYDSTQLFRSGWTKTINRMILTTATGGTVDEKTCSFTYALGVLSLAAPVEFDVSSPTNDISYVELVQYIATPTEIRFSIYRKDLTQVYDFLTSGKLTVDDIEFTLSAPQLTNAGMEALFTKGWDGEISTVRLRNTLGNTIVSQAITFGVDGGTGNLVMQGGTNTLVVPANSSFVSRIELLDGTSQLLWDRELPAPAPYSFAVESDFRLLSWEFSI